MKSEIFLIDIDGVACAHAKAICKWVNEKYGLNSEENDVTTWDHNFGPITFTEAVRECYDDINFIIGMEVTPGFNEFLKYITNLVTVKFASTRKKSHDATRLWIKNNFGNDFEVLFVKEKTEISFDYLVDDRPEEVKSAAEKSKTVFLLSQPWNNNQHTLNLLREFNNIYFAKSFADIIDFFNNHI